MVIEIGLRPVARLNHSFTASGIPPDSDKLHSALGLVLKKLRDDHPEEFREALQELPFGQRTAYYYIEVVTAFSPYVEAGAVELRRLRGIGSTALSALAKLVTPSELEALLQMAEKYTVKELKFVLAGLAPDHDGSKITFNLTPDEFESLTTVLSKFGAGTVGKEAALMLAVKALEQGS